MGWLSQCVCGGKKSNNNKSKKKKHKSKKSGTGRGDVYAIQDDNNRDENEENFDSKIAESCSRDSQVLESPAKGKYLTDKIQAVKIYDNNNSLEESAHIGDCNYELEFHDSLSDTSSPQTLQKTSASKKENKDDENQEIGKSFVGAEVKCLVNSKSNLLPASHNNSQFPGGNENSLATSVLRDREELEFHKNPKIQESGNESNIRFGTSSCSFMVPIGEEKNKSNRHEKRRVVNSMIPKLSNKMKNKENGRIHVALVSGVNWEQRSVTVEWFEKGETKGKEVEIDAILALNPELMPKSMPPPQINNMMGTRARHSTRPSIPVKAGSNRQVTRGHRPTNIMPPGSMNGNNNTVAGLTSRRELENIPPAMTGPVFANTTTASLNKSKQIQPPQQQTQSQVQQQVNSQIPQGENGRGRRSNVVKEVERLKKNREERRQRQAELKEEKEALMNLDPGNPNWEFLAMIREYQNCIDFRPLCDLDVVEDHQITVCVRKRPLNKKELTRKEVDVISVPSKDQMVVHEPKSKVDLTKFLENQLFRFDYAFDETCTNEIVYKYTAKPLVQTIFDGGMATCFAYGQTGSGKTHTMGGDFSEKGKTQDCKKGIYAMVAKDVFEYLKSPTYRASKLIISASFFEIYSGKVFDLLADKEKLRVLEDGKQQVQIVGLTEKVVETCDEVLKLIQHGNSARTSGQTSANSNSSRSHAVFQIIARTSGAHKVHGKFSLIDLAGNERGADTSSANRQTRMEGAEINKSLLALKECIRALGRKGTHLPFRASKLTQVLRDSFIGERSKTCMIAMISPGMSSCEHSLNTLRYADRVKELAATDPTESKISPTDDDRLFKIEEPANDNVPSDSDLAQLRSLNEGEISQDLYTFHEAVSALQLMEEEVVDTHKAVIDQTTQFLDHCHGIFSATHEVDYDQEDSRANPKANSIIGDWEDCDESVNSTVSHNEIKNTIEDENMDNMRRNSFADSNRQKLPWRLEKKKSSSTTSSQASGRTVTKMTPRWKKKTLGYSTKKSCFDKSLTFRTFHGSSKKLMSPRPRLNTTSQKKSKYSWTGRFNSRTNKKIPPSENTVDSDNRPESGICSITRTPSPVDNNFYYGNDPDTMERVFHLNSSLKNHQNDLKIQFPGEFQIGESSDDFKSKNYYAEDSREVNQVRRRFGSRNVNLNLFPEILRDHTTFMNNPNLLMDIDDDDDRMLPSIKDIGMKEKYNGDFDKAGNGNIYRKVTDFCCAFFANVVLFSFLPIIYIAFFIYIDKGDGQI